MTGGELTSAINSAAQMGLFEELKDKLELPTLRDRFAMAALPGVYGHYKGCEFSDGSIAQTAYHIADLMLLERTKHR